MMRQGAAQGKINLSKTRDALRISIYEQASSSETTVFAAISLTPCFSGVLVAGGVVTASAVFPRGKPLKRLGVLARSTPR